MGSKHFPQQIIKMFNGIPSKSKLHSP